MAGDPGTVCENEMFAYAQSQEQLGLLKRPSEPSIRSRLR
jgi:hypothetical protein